MHSSQNQMDPETAEKMAALREEIARSLPPEETTGPATPQPAALEMKINIVKGKVVLDFGQPVHSIGLGRMEALNLAHHLRVHADLLGRAARQRHKKRRAGPDLAHVPVPEIPGITDQA